MLACNVTVQEKEDSLIDVSTVDPMALMQAVENSLLIDLAGEVRIKLKKVIDSL